MKISFLNRNIFIILFFILLSSCSVIKNLQSTSNLKNHVKYLASDQLEGRYPASAGGLLAAEYIRDYFSENGLVLYNQDGFQHFNIITKSYLGPNNQLTFNNNSYVVSDDFIPLSYGLNTTLNSEIYFAGYGFDINNDSLMWNDYKNYNSKNKWVMKFRGSPDNDNPHGDYASYSSLRKKAIIAKDNGASGVIFVSTSGFDAEDNFEIEGLTVKSSQPIPTANIALKINEIDGLDHYSEEVIRIASPSINYESQFIFLT